MVSKALQRQAQEIGEIEVGWGGSVCGGKMILCKHWNEQKREKKSGHEYGGSANMVGNFLFSPLHSIHRKSRTSLTQLRIWQE